MSIAERSSGDVTILEIQGRLTLGDSTEDLRAAVNKVLAAGKSRIVLQLAGVPFVDSAGLGEIVRAVTQTKRSGGAVKLAGPTQRILDLLKIAKVQSFVDSYATEEEAIRSFPT